MCTSVRIDTLWSSRKVFHFIQAVSLEIASDGTVRGDGSSAARYVCFFQDTFPLTPSRTYTQSRRTIIKKMEGEGSLLIRPANCGTSPSNPSAILDPIIFEEKPRRTHSFSLFLSVQFQNPFSPFLFPRFTAITISVRSMEHGHMCRYMYG